MKIRTGFVSNSSSSSFIIAYKTKPTKDELAKKIFKVDEKSLFYSIAQDMAKMLLYADEYDAEWEYIPMEEAKKLMKKGFKIYEGCVSDEGNSSESLLCDLTLSYEDDELYLKKDGGY